MIRAALHALEAVVALTARMACGYVRPELGNSERKPASLVIWTSGQPFDAAQAS